MGNIRLSHAALVALLLCPRLSGAFVTSPHDRFGPVAFRPGVAEMSANADGDGEPDVAGEEAPVIAQSVVRIDDGGSDLTDRFKYKVNALMGTFDPPGGSADDENQNGNILNAMMTFPTQYAFNVVGKTGGGDAAKESYVETVKGIIASSSGDDERAMECRVTPRGAKFTRVSVTAMVGSAAVINTIYDELAALEMTVMRY